jgi:hypothetical protein
VSSVIAIDFAVRQSRVWYFMKFLCTKKFLRPCYAGLVAGMCVAIVVAVLVIILYRRKRLQMQSRARLMKERADILSTSGGGKSAKLFTRKEMKRATNGFAKDRVLGIGGFGEVYKGILKDGTVVAVKTAKSVISKESSRF